MQVGSSVAGERQNGDAWVQQLNSPAEELQIEAYPRKQIRLVQYHRIGMAINLWVPISLQVPHHADPFLHEMISGFVGWNALPPGLVERDSVLSK
jgi:hypothetical protein